MKNYRIDYSQERINQIIESLRRAMDLCKSAGSDDCSSTNNYAYAAGYSGSCIDTAIEDLQLVQSMLNEIN